MEDESKRFSFTFLTEIGSGIGFAIAILALGFVCSNGRLFGIAEDPTVQCAELADGCRDDCRGKDNPSCMSGCSDSYSSCVKRVKGLENDGQ